MRMSCVDGVCKRTHRVWISLPHINALQKGWMAEEETLNKQMDMMAFPVNASALAFSAVQCQSSMTSISAKSFMKETLPKAGLATTPLLLNAWPSAVQSNAEPLICYNPSRTYIAIGCQVHYLRSLLPWRRWQLIFTRNDTYSDYGFAFKLASTIICKPQMGCFWRDQTSGSQQIKKLVFENSNKIQKVLARLDQ